MKIGDHIEFLWNGHWQPAELLKIDNPPIDDYPYFIETEINAELTKLWTNLESIREINEFEIDDTTPLIPFSRCPLCGYFGRAVFNMFECTNSYCRNHKT